MLYAGIHEHELVALGIEGEILVLKSFAVEADEAAFLSEDRGELIHDTALYSAVVVLRALADLGEFELVDTVAEEFVQRECEGAFEGCGGG